ncbi:MAG: hypothetical protein MUF36_04665 [Bacteroidales bacterium]|nr:hypothetical protein [Bacteroidales bacterium]
MRPLLKFIQLLLLLELLILAAGFFIISKSGTGIGFGEVALLSSILTIVALVTLIIFFRGQERDPASQTLHSLVAVTLKFLLELVIAFLWFFVAKKTQLSSVVLFFVLYLTFTMFLVLIMIKTLKNKSL